MVNGLTLFLNWAWLPPIVGIAAVLQFPVLFQLALVVPVQLSDAAHEFVGKPNKNAASKAPFTNNELAEADDKRRTRLE
jgi:hypothetical protein